MWTAVKSVQNAYFVLNTFGRRHAPALKRHLALPTSGAAPTACPICQHSPVEGAEGGSALDQEIVRLLALFYQRGHPQRHPATTSPCLRPLVRVAVFRRHL